MRTSLQGTHQIVAVRPAPSVDVEAQVAILDEGAPARVLDRSDHADRLLAERLINGTYQHLESRKVARSTGDVLAIDGLEGNPGVRWWLGRKTIVIQWSVPEGVGRPGVLLTRVPRPWLMTRGSTAAIAEGVEMVGVALSAQPLRKVVEGALEQVRVRLSSPRGM